MPESWRRHIHASLPLFKLLPEEDQNRLVDLVRIFVFEKHWLGCDGLEMTEEIQVRIASQACLLILNLPHNYYDHVDSIYVYPVAVVSAPPMIGMFDVVTEPISTMPISGQTFLIGPVILVWDEIERDTRHPDRGHNVVYHEFAHKLDMLDGRADGVPQLAQNSEYKDWERVLSQAYIQLHDLIEKGEKTFFDPYGATNEAEFFAVITEVFFTQPKKLMTHRGELYDVLAKFYRQDPVQLMP